MEGIVISRRRLLQTVALSAAGMSCRPVRRPNILLVVSDDQSYPHAGVYGAQNIQTPAFDRIAREGVLFDNSFCNSPSCTPSRSSILSGLYPWQLEEAGVLYGTIPRKYPIVTHLLADAGYHTGFTGKGWGPGDWAAGGLTRHPNGKEYNSRQHATTPRVGIDPRDYASNFSDFLRDRPKGAPFFFWLGSTEPHRAYAKGAGLATGHSLNQVNVPSYWPDTPEVRSDILDYISEIEWFDVQLSRALGVLASAGELENTLIVVTSDNGMPFARSKVNLYDPGVHMPLAIRWGGHVSPGRKVSDFVQHSDLAPTFLEAAGLPVPKTISGRSLLPILNSNASGQIEPARDFALTGMERHVMARPDGATYPMRALRTSEYLYIRNFAPERWPTGGPDFLSSNRTPHGDVDSAPSADFMLLPESQTQYPASYSLCFGKRPAEEFYRLATDADQVHNLAGEATAQPALLAYRNRLESLLRQTGDPRIEGKDPWQAYVYRQTTGYGSSFNASLPEARRAAARDEPRHKPE